MTEADPGTQNWFPSICSGFTKNLSERLLKMLFLCIFLPQPHKQGVLLLNLNISPPAFLCSSLNDLFNQDKLRQAKGKPWFPPTDALSKSDLQPAPPPPAAAPSHRSGAKRRPWCLPWGFLYISGIVASHNCESLTFCGTGPMSEPETKAVSSFIESKKEAVPCFHSCHSWAAHSSALWLHHK